MDLRNSRDAEQENKRINLEINNIQSKFKHHYASNEVSTNANSNGKDDISLSGYQKKKYICKLVYIYLLGYSEATNFGVKEPLNLAASTVYSEKQTGYLALSILFRRSPTSSLKDHLNDLMDVMNSSLLKDLQSNNEDFNCLALHFIASNFNIDNERIDTEGSSKIHIVDDQDENARQWLELTDLVFSFATSPIVAKHTRKKAVLALHVLFKLYPGVIISNSNWVPRILSLLEENEDLGLLTSSIPLIEFITTSISAKYAKSTMSSIARNLHRLLIEDACPKEYYYYSVPAPWLLVKLLSLVELLFLLVDEKTGNTVLTLTDLDLTTIGNLRLVISRSIQNSSQPVKGLPKKNSNSSILFQAVSLVIFLNASNEAVKGAVNALIYLLDSHETNTRYLSLDALIKLIGRGSISDVGNVFFTNEFNILIPKLFHLLSRDKDVSIKRKTLDLLYTLCNGSNYINIINGILEFYPHCEYSLKGEVAIKVAVLSEKYATELTWYVTTMLNLISQGTSAAASTSTNSHGSSTQIGNEVWERIVQIIVNNEELQAQSCKKIISLCNKSNGSNAVSENIIKVGGFVLGEYGHLIANEKSDGDDDYSAESQFQILFSGYFRSSLSTRAMLLTSFLKFFEKYQDEPFIPDIIDLFEISTQSIDLEIQTRGFEYLKLCTSDNLKELLSVVTRQFPVFEKKVSPLMSRIGNVERIVGRNRSSSFVNPNTIQQQKPAKSPSVTPPPASGLTVPPLNAPFKGVGQHRSVSTLSLPVTEEIDEDESNDEGQVESGNQKALDGDEDPFHDGAKEKVVLSPNWYHGYHRMLQYDAGIFYENQFVKILYRIIKSNSNIQYKFTIINNAAKTAGTNLTGFTILDLESSASKTDPNYLIQLGNQPQQTIADKTTFDVNIKIRNIVENDESPIITLSFNSGGSFNQLKLKFPVCFLRTLTSTNQIELEDFKKRWLQIGEQLPGPQGECISRTLTNYRCNSLNVVRLLARLGFNVVYSTPDNTEAGILVMGAGILHSQKSNYGVLVTIRSTDDVGKEFEIMVRCTGGGISEVINSSLREVLEGKF